MWRARHGTRGLPDDDRSDRLPRDVSGGGDFRLDSLYPVTARWITSLPRRNRCPRPHGGRGRRAGFHGCRADDPVRALFLEIARGDAWDRVFVALDFFDASINRIAAYVIGARATRQAILLGLLDPSAKLRAAENAGRGHERLALMEHAKALPWGAVWDKLCERAGVPPGADWLKNVARIEKTVLARRK